MPITRFESRTQPLAPRGVFLRRLGFNVLLSLGLIVVSLAAGMVGYRWTAGMGWLDAFQNAAMILSGMGPVDPLQNPGAKFFAGCYALYSGLAVIVTTGIILAPVLHRVLHGLHVPDEDDEQDDEHGKAGKKGSGGAGKAAGAGPRSKSAVKPPSKSQAQSTSKSQAKPKPRMG